MLTMVFIGALVFDLNSINSTEMCLQISVMVHCLVNLGIQFHSTSISNLTNQAYCQTIFIQKFLIGGGIEHKFLSIRSKTLDSTRPYFEKSNYGSIFGYVKYDALDNKYFPKNGWYFFGDYQSYLYSSDYTNQFNQFSIAKGDIGFAQTLFQ
jgi:NTE family protein